MCLTGTIVFSFQTYCGSSEDRSFAFIRLIILEAVNFNRLVALESRAIPNLIAFSLVQAIDVTALIQLRNKAHVRKTLGLQSFDFRLLVGNFVHGCFNGSQRGILLSRKELLGNLYVVTLFE